MVIILSKNGTKVAEHKCHDSRITSIIVSEDEIALVSIGLDGKLALISLKPDIFDNLEYSLNYGPLTAICFGGPFAVSNFSFYVGSISGNLILFDQGWFKPQEHEISTLSKAITNIM